VWKLKPANVAVASTVRLNAQQVVLQRQQAILPKTTLPMSLVTKPLSSSMVAATAIKPVAAHIATAAAVNATLAKPTLVTTAHPAAAGVATIKPQALFAQKLVPQSAYSRFKLGTQLQTLDLTQKKLDLSHIDVANRYQLTNLINQQLPTKPASTSDGFSISFKYCRVNIDRSWFKLALLKMKSWYMFGTQAGEYSTGSSTSNPGMFPLLPTSFIAIRDLKITANWSQEDRQTLGQATALGFFDIRDATLNADTLEVKGLQILGWISSLMPELPPMPSQ
jgi:hypothetical protein